MRTLLPQFLDRVFAASQSTEHLKLVDLGCGTGRNTLQLLEAVASQKKNRDLDPSNNQAPGTIEVIGLDASPGMLDVAREAVESAGMTEGLGISLGLFDLLQPVSDPDQLPLSLRDSGAYGVISTLVLEHIPLQQFFSAAAAIVNSGGYLLVTNMHADMGAISQAGFTDPQTGVKIRPTSYCHSIAEMLVAAKEAGFQVEDLSGQNGGSGVLERTVDEAMGEVLGERAKKWVGVTVWFGVCFRKV